MRWNEGVLSSQLLLCLDSCVFFLICKHCKRAKLLLYLMISGNFKHISVFFSIKVIVPYWNDSRGLVFQTECVLSAIDHWMEPPAPAASQIQKHQCVYTKTGNKLHSSECMGYKSSLWLSHLARNSMSIYLFIHPPPPTNVVCHNKTLELNWISQIWRSWQLE